MGTSEASVERATAGTRSRSGTSGAPASCRLDKACLVAAALFWRTAFISANFGRMVPAVEEQDVMVLAADACECCEMSSRQGADHLPHNCACWRLLGVCSAK